MRHKLSALVALLLAAGTSFWLAQVSGRRWAHRQAMPQISRLASQHKPVAAFLLARKARKYLPRDPQLARIMDAITAVTSVRSSPSGASVEIKDYLSPGDPWSVLGTTPLDNVRVPSGYLRWRVSKAGLGRYSGDPINFDTSSGTVFVLGAEPRR